MITKAKYTLNYHYNNYIDDLILFTLRNLYQKRKQNCFSFFPQNQFAAKQNKKTNSENRQLPLLFNHQMIYYIGLDE
ncbi:hypothetical protein DERF_011870 [Dermatophagoides farinae]|uniref:Uncharacterized protein n=1 Tax=Dermatophagoides farinae TaxID=6954 RepID=A0A922HNI7_DERFA|nr:hypothetical protein DERF_011870 [Dermatophagoides farinae]